jgi:HSP20 family protein
MAALIRWNPCRGPLGLNREWENFLEEFGWPARRRWQGEEEGAESTWLPAVDMTETKDEYALKVDLPGLAKEDVKVTFTEDVLTIAGEKKAEKETKEHNLHRSERVFGAFTRSFRLPGPVAGDKIKAEFKNGVLSLNVPKAEGSKPQEIQIQ